MNKDSSFDIKGTTISADDLVLDLGTKDGTTLSGCPGTVVGIDIDDSQFPETTDTELILGDGRTLPFDTDVFDYVHCSVVLEHVDGSGSLISEAARVLKSSGVAFFGFPNRISLLQPHMLPRYYSILPKPLGRLLAPLLLSERETEYYENALFPLTPITARHHLHSNLRVS
ncbi:class I SAM-dependent methyltransferase [Halobellus marinus]|uniref:class I SAM-dependent methyltransferase n=1 Tax=Halobellus TaxID=1073986 RepID=UPI0028B049EF|nr:class I SAM-dependent methyltransferase [Halobellus sp. DFY28]